MMLPLSLPIMRLNFLDKFIHLPFVSIIVCRRLVNSSIEPSFSVCFVVIVLVLLVCVTTGALVVARQRNFIRLSFFFLEDTK